MIIRLADSNDVEKLVKMRWDFTNEDYPEMASGADYSIFNEECGTFLEKALHDGKWFIWLAEEDENIVSHIYIERIDKIPRPGRITHPFVYMTNVYTLPEYRGKGIGSKLISRVNEWAKEMEFEFIIVWPSDTSIEFYARNGYSHSSEPMEKQF